MKQNVSFSVTAKLLTIGLLVLIMLIPQTMIESVIYEREARRNETSREISSGWGLEQVVAGPVIRVPYYSNLRDTQASDYRVLRTVTFLPDSLSVSGMLRPEVRYRGIYEVTLYQADLKIDGFFDGARFGEFEMPLGKVLWDRAEASMGVSDIGGIINSASLTWDTTTQEFLPQARDPNDLLRGIYVPLGQLAKDSAGIHRFSVPLMLNGSGTVRFVPLGKQTQVDVSSSWPHPGFVGRFLPTRREIRADGFDAAWRLYYLSRSYPQQWLADQEMMEPLRESAFGVQLYFPVDFYQQTTRSTKYALMFIVLTFTAFFLFEVLLKLRIHPIQYLLIGFAITLFYLLLLSLAEQIGFIGAYVVASIATTLLISAYSASVLPEKRWAKAIGGLLLALYLYLYVLLQIQDYALLIGTVGLFAILGGIMYVTRNIAWYGEKTE